ncbi:MAG TPA: divergent polysaccharide deacetylase family protein, partial [Xanthobacteraceae bacterium]
MTLDDLAAPLGQGPKRRPRRIRIRVAQFIAGALALFLGVFVVWAIVGDDPSGGEPRVIVPAHPQIAAKSPSPPPQTVDVTGAIQNGQPAAATPPGQPAIAANTMTVTIIDGKTGAKQEVTIPSRAAAAVAATAATGPTGPGIYEKFFETTTYG